MRHREVLEFLRLTLQYSSIGIRRLTATSRMWLRRKRILPAEDKSAHTVLRGSSDQLSAARQHEDVRGCLWYACVCVLGHVWLFGAPWTVAHQAPLSMDFLGKST